LHRVWGITGQTELLFTQEWYTMKWLIDVQFRHKFMTWTSVFNARVDLVGCVVDIMARGTIFSQIFSNFSCYYNSTHNPYCFICYLWCGQQNLQRLQFQQMYCHPTLRV